ncbi:MAG: hypothetical protein J7K40_00795 [candidate division Zixibacteria bacterium]|nr:hypothetical protein [candidate division Zixibacteria bacterium]
MLKNQQITAILLISKKLSESPLVESLPLRVSVSLYNRGSLIDSFHLHV